MVTQQQKEISQTTHTDEWTLTPSQMLFLMQNHNTIEAAFAADDLEFLHQFAASDEFIQLFGNMGFDEAYDRYETMLEDGDAT